MAGWNRKFGVRASGLVLAGVLAAGLMGAIKPPPAAEWDAATAGLAGKDAAAQDAAAAKIRGWMAGGWISVDLYKKWLPSLMANKRYDLAAEFAMTGVLGRPNPDAITTLLEFRVNSLLALDKGADALEAAKSYYNACDFKGTSKAVDLVGRCLAKARPDDLEVVRKWRDEQAKASAGTPVEGDGVLKSVTINADPYEASLKDWSGKTRFVDKTCYADLLLAADKGSDAEKVYRECFQLAATQEDLAIATEGIAKCLRAEDGNVARANKWLADLKKAGPARALPSAAELKKATASAPADLP